MIEPSFDERQSPVPLESSDFMKSFFKSICIIKTLLCQQHTPGTNSGSFSCSKSDADRELLAPSILCFVSPSPKSTIGKVDLFVYLGLYFLRYERMLIMPAVSFSFSSMTPKLTVADFNFEFSEYLCGKAQHTSFANFSKN